LLAVGATTEDAVFDDVQADTITKKKNATAPRMARTTEEFSNRSADLSHAARARVYDSMNALERS
jgi:hypothetical protein